MIKFQSISIIKNWLGNFCSNCLWIFIQWLPCWMKTTISKCELDLLDKKSRNENRKPAFEKDLLILLIFASIYPRINFICPSFSICGWSRVWLWRPVALTDSWQGQRSTRKRATTSFIALFFFYSVLDIFINDFDIRRVKVCSEESLRDEALSFEPAGFGRDSNCWKAQA